MLRFIIEEVENGYAVQECGKRDANDEHYIGGRVHVFLDWEGVSNFLREPPFKEPEQLEEPTVE